VEQEPIIGLDLKKFRGLLNADLHEKQRRVMAELLAEYQAQLADRDATAPTVEGEMERRIRSLQDGLTHLQRLTELGQVVSVLVHEVSQPLTAISNYTAACRRLATSGEPEQLESGLKQIADQTDRAWQIVRRIREFVK
jgi:C4-dicarboxylate-specific signal transduction histidine kinase